MDNKKPCHGKHHVQNRKHLKRGRGPSSFGMHDSEQAFEHLALQEGDTFLDLGCGAGEYSLYAANLVGSSGKVFSLDIGEEMLEGLRKEAEKSGLENIQTLVADIFKPLVIKKNSVDICMLATVLHAKNVIEKASVLFNEVRRVLKPNGRLVIIECKKEEMLFGPPIEFRVSPKELEKSLFLYGFKKVDYMDLGFNYMILFE